MALKMGKEMGSFSYGCMIFCINFIVPSSSSLLNLLYSQIFNSPLLCFLFSARMLFSAFSPLYLCFKPSPSIFRELLCKFSSSLLFFLFCMNLALPVLQLCLFSILHELGSASSSALLFFSPLSAHFKNPPLQTLSPLLSPWCCHFIGNEKLPL